MLRTILSVSGKPGLFRLLSHGNGNLIVESLTDKRRQPIHAKDRVVSRGGFKMYKKEDDQTQSEVLSAGDKHIEGKAIDMSAHTTTDALQESFGKCVPNFDRERVYPSDIKKLFTWYNILIAAGFTSFTEEETAE